MGRAATLFGFLGAPLAWAAHLAVSYFLVALGCTTAWSGSRAAIIVATIVFGVVAAAAGWLGWQARAQDPSGIREFLGHGGAALAALFTLAILLAGISPLFLPLCEFRTG